MKNKIQVEFLQTIDGLGDPFAAGEAWSFTAGQQAELVEDVARDWAARGIVLIIIDGPSVAPIEGFAAEGF